MADIAPEFLKLLPERTAEAFERVVPDHASPSPELLIGLIRSHLDVVAEAETGEFVDTHLARVIADRLFKMLESWEQFSDAYRQLAHATVTYFVMNDDADCDLSSPTGFDDDAEIANALFTYLGRVDLLIDLD